MADHSQITLACFGLVGTLVTDDGLLDLAFAEAIATQGVVSGTSAYARCMSQVHRARGQSPADVLSTLFPENQAKVQAAHLAFNRSLAGAVARSSFSLIPGAKDVLTDLAESGCRVCVMTSMPRRELTSMLRTAGLHDLIAVTLSVDDVPRGCPSPDLALAAMLRVGVGDVREVAVVHGTAAGVECGRRAGARIVAGVLTGPHPAARLRAAGATHVISSVAKLPKVLSTLGESAPHGVVAATPDAASLTVPAQVPLEGRSLGR